MSALAAARPRALVSRAVLVFGFAILAGQIGSADAAAAGSIDRGEKLFRHVWENHDLVAGPGDGLGPMYNERSCIACHYLGGAGGAGPNLKNVDILTAAPPKDARQVPALLSRLARVHRGFGRGTSVVLHRFSTDEDYLPFREALLAAPAKSKPKARGALAVAAKQRKSPQADDPVQAFSRLGVELFLSHRNTTPLFGAHLIDRISDNDIKETGIALSLGHPGISGRFVGRFGWRGQVAGLRNFVLGACAVEIGLHNSTQAQAASPLRGALQNLEPDLTPTYCDDLVAYVASLERPGRMQPADSQQAVFIFHGEGLFDTVGCAACHVRKLGDVDELYSDLLLHDMGTRLEDPASAATFASSEYYGPPPDLTSPFAAERRREWKTPPLWGLHDSKPYLHDGRAATIEEAIGWHSGEASQSLNRYLALSVDDRRHVLLFLDALRAPMEGPKREN